MATTPSADRKMIQFPVTNEEHKALRIKAIQDDTNLIELCRVGLGLPPEFPASSNGSQPVAAD